MKKISGKILAGFLLLCSACILADDEVFPETLNLSNTCGEPLGVIYASRWGSSTEIGCVITGSHPDGGYFSPASIHEGGIMGYSNKRVFWYTDGVNPGSYKYYSNASNPGISDCAQEFYDYVQNLTDEQRSDVEAVYENYFPSGRYDMDADDDGDGYLDYYDLDCERYDEYLQYCEDNGIEPMDLVDYQYFQDNSIEDWLAQRNNMNDTDGDGFSDGYETIHGTSIYDGSDYPLGLPDTGDSLLIVGGIDEKEPWRQEQYNDSGYSRGFVYDQGYDPFGDAVLNFEDDPDWGLLDSDNDGLLNFAELANGTDPYRFEFQSGFSYVYDEEGGFYYVTGYTEDGAFGDYGTAPTKEEWLESYGDYEVGNYTFNPSEYTFGDTKYDSLLNKTGKIKFDCDNVRPQTQRDYKLHFNLPIPGTGTQVFTVAVMPDQSTPAGAAIEIVRQLVRGIAGVIFSYVFVKHVWLAIRQY